MSTKLTFYGAAGTVTGSRSVLTFKNKRYLIDCGLFQGPKDLRLKNWEPWIDPKSIDAVILTHAHIDHSGYLPRFIKDGYDGPVYCSHGTAELLSIMLPDSAHLQEEDAAYANKTGHSKHKPALPLYTEHEARMALEKLEPKPRHKWIQLTDGLSFQFLKAGHIIGACQVQFSMTTENGVRLLTFSGDLGNERSPTITGPEYLVETDYLVLESTYGDRVQIRSSPEIELAKYLKEISKTGGVLLIPAFSVGRTQDLLHLFKKIEDAKLAPSVPVFVDSPMATDANAIFLRHPEDHKLVIENKKVVPSLCPDCYREVRSVQESFALTQRGGPMVVISAAGMLSGGRILHHLKTRLSRPENIVLFVGFQAEGTKGRLLQSGIDQLRIHHQEVPVKAKIATLDSLSAHADSLDLLKWVKEIRRKPKMIFFNHGEPSATQALCSQIESEFGITGLIAKQGQTVEL